MAGRRRNKKNKSKSSSSLKRQRVIVRSVLFLFVLTAVFYMLFETASSLNNIFFRENPYFKLNKYKIELIHEGDLTKMHLFRNQFDNLLTKLEEQNKGSINLFKLNLKTLRSQLLIDNPQVQKIKLIRKLPEGMEVTVIDRTPVARLFNSKGLLIDRTGYVLPSVKGMSHLPTLIGIHNRESVKTGEITRNSDVNCALRLINHLAASPYGALFDISYLNCAENEQLTLSLHKSPYNADNCRIIIPRNEISGSLNRAARILDMRQTESKITHFIDATYKINPPVK